MAQAMPAMPAMPSMQTHAMPMQSPMQSPALGNVGGPAMQMPAMQMPAMQMPAMQMPAMQSASVDGAQPAPSYGGANPGMPRLNAMIVGVIVLVAIIVVVVIIVMFLRKRNSGEDGGSAGYRAEDGADYSRREREREREHYSRRAYPPDTGAARGYARGYAGYAGDADAAGYARVRTAGDARGDAYEGEQQNRLKAPVVIKPPSTSSMPPSLAGYREARGYADDYDRGNIDGDDRMNYAQRQRGEPRGELRGERGEPRGERREEKDMYRRGLSVEEVVGREVGEDPRIRPAQARQVSDSSDRRSDARREERRSYSTEHSPATAMAGEQLMAAFDQL